MERLYTKMEALQEIMSCVENLYVWQYDYAEGEGMVLHVSNCREEAFWHDIFKTRFAKVALKACKDSKDSVFLGDDIGILWIATPGRNGGRLQKVWLLGPVVESDLTEMRITERLKQKQVSIAYKRDFFRKLKQLPAVSHSVFCMLGTMLHFCVTGERIRMTDIRMQDSENVGMPAADEERNREQMRIGAEHEALMLKAVREGNLQYGNQPQGDAYEIPGLLAPGNPLRQFQDEIIVSITLCSRAAIAGGLSRETALMMSDSYIQAVEAAATVPEVGAIHMQMRREYAKRVHDLKQMEGASPAVVAVKDYVDCHVTSRLTVAEVAASIGYAGYYISTLFKEETGQTLSDYIQKKKLEYAAFLLRESSRSVKEIAELLHYSSASHFCAVFRKEMKMTPAQYRQEREK